MIFDKVVRIHGEHALYMDALAGTGKLFHRNIDLFFIAPLIGYLLGKNEDVDITEDTTKANRAISLEQLSAHSQLLDTLFQVVILQHYEKQGDVDEAIDRAFREPARMNKTYDENGSEIMTKTEAHLEDIEIFMGYVRGGIAHLYDEIIGNGNNMDDFIRNAVTFIEQYSVYCIEDITPSQMQSSLGNDSTMVQ